MLSLVFCPPCVLFFGVSCLGWQSLESGDQSDGVQLCFGFNRLRCFCAALHL
jgi:hypothetical protein